MTTDNDISKATTGTANPEPGYGEASEKDASGPAEAVTSEYTDTDSPAGPAAEAPADKADRQSPSLRYMAVGGAVCALLAWAFLVFSEWVSISFDIVAIALSAVSCRLRPGNMRNLAITALVAAGTLALVFATLFVLLHILENL